MERQEIYKAIDSERDYQDKRWSKGSGYSTDKERKPAEWLIYIEEHLRQAKGAVYNYNDKEVMEQIRKIAGLCVAAGEANGMPERKIEENA